MLKPLRPSSIKSLTPLKLKFDFDNSTPKDWIKDDLFMTHFLNAMSLTFPDGERFFMDSVRYFKNEIKDEQLQKDIQGFITQEAFHGNAHEKFNKFLKDQGYPVESLIELVQITLDKIQKLCQEHNSTESIQLALTCGLEHITAILGDLLLTRHDLTNRMQEPVKSMWIWHAIEETEHKAVAYDVYDMMFQNYLERVGVFLVASIVFLVVIHAFQAVLLHKDDSNDLQTWIGGLNKLYGINGYITSIIPMWASYMKPKFHPWKDGKENSHLISLWKHIIKESVQQKRNGLIFL